MTWLVCAAAEERDCAAERAVAQRLCNKHGKDADVCQILERDTEGCLPAVGLRQMVERQAQICV